MYRYINNDLLYADEMVEWWDHETGEIVSCNITGEWMPWGQFVLEY